MWIPLLLQPQLIHAVFFPKKKTDLMWNACCGKRLVTAVDSWNEKVTEYRRWFLRRKDAVSNIPNFVSNQWIAKLLVSNKSQKEETQETATTKRRMTRRRSNRWIRL
jgi:hypothetical protein